jgi:hypothetical protein
MEGGGGGLTGGQRGVNEGKDDARRAKMNEGKDDARRGPR